MLPDGMTAPEVPPSSRLCVKNLPKYVEDARLKEFFSAKGEVTDAKVLRTRDGRSRQLGFIGFKSVEEAAAALRYYNKSYMDTMRLEVEYARKVGDEQLPRAWSKHTAGTTAHKKAHPEQQQQQLRAGGAGPDAGGAAGVKDGGKGRTKGKKDEPLPGEDEEDPKLREFLALMQPRTKAKIWANDELAAAADQAAAAAAATAAQAPPAKSRKQPQGQEQGQGLGAESDAEEEEEYQDWTAAAGGRRGAAAAGRDDEDDDVSMEEGDQDGEEEERPRGDTVVVNEAVSDLEYLRSRMRRWDEEEEHEETAAAAAQATARGDQSGVGTSPHCMTAAGRGSKAGKKETGKKAKEEAAGAGNNVTSGKRPGGANEDDGAGGDSGSEDAGGRQGHDEEMEDAEEETDQAANQQGGQNPQPQPQEGQKPWRKQQGQANGAKEAGGAGQPGDEEEDEGLLGTGRLFVRNLAYTATEGDLGGLFGGLGELREVHLVLDRETKRSKGLAYVQFQIPEDAVRAARQLDGTIFQGRLLHILPAKRAPGAAGAAAGGGDGAGLGGAEEELAGAGGSEAGPDGAKAPGGATSSFKAAREAQRRADAGTNRAAWNTLFMRADTVAEAVAAHYGLSKAQLLDAGTAAAGEGEGRAGRRGDSVAVRMALGEAQVIAATKTALAEAGVSVEALENAAAASGKAASIRSVARSSTTLLVKNLPFSTNEDELRDMFGRVGPVLRLVLPPARALALVEFSEPQDARAAFRSLAYKKFHHVPLYLEWAPADVFSEPPPHQPAHCNHQQQQGAAPPGTAAGEQQQQQAAKRAGGKGVKVVDVAAAHAIVTDPSSTEPADPSSAAPSVVGTIYVKNLAFATSDAALRAHFAAAVAVVGGSLHSAVVARRKPEDEPKKGKKGKKGAGKVDKGDSLGFGFVEVDSEAVASALISKMQGSMLDGHKLALQLSRARSKAGEGGAAAAATGGPGKSSKKGGAGADGDASTKLVVRNLAFEATKKDIQGLFNPFGHLKSCRLPKKFDGSHRGFAFVEFVTKQEARNALEGVGGTHLYGRRLVAEYAREDDGLDELRNKTAAIFKRDGEVAAGSEAPAKRLKI